MANLKNVIYAGTEFRSITDFCKFAEINTNSFNWFVNKNGLFIAKGDAIDEIVESYLNRIPAMKKHAEVKDGAQNEILIQNYENSTYEELAHKCGIPVGQVGAKLSKLRREGRIHYKQTNPAALAAIGKDMKCHIAASYIYRNMDFVVDSKEVYNISNVTFKTIINSFLVIPEYNWKILPEDMFEILVEVVIRNGVLHRWDYKTISGDIGVPYDDLFDYLNQIYLILDDETLSSKWETKYSDEHENFTTECGNKLQEFIDQQTLDKMREMVDEPSDQLTNDVDEIAKEKPENVNDYCEGKIMSFGFEKEEDEKFAKYYMLYGKERAASRFNISNEEAYMRFLVIKDEYEITIELKKR